jgi:type IV pilus assembly protein PilY1
MDRFVDGPVNSIHDQDPFDNAGEQTLFHTDSGSEIMPFTGLQDYEQVLNLIEYIRENYISETADILDFAGTSVSEPSENYHIIYKDESYQTFFDEYKNRETVVYLGAANGMIHAFTASTPDKPTECELWTYIPESFLPHLQCLTPENYSPVYFADLQPKVFDAKILTDDTHYSDNDSEENWGTFILVPVNPGHGHIQIEADFDYNPDSVDTFRTFSPGYALIDITDPDSPNLMWERSYENLELTTSLPAVVKTGENWFAVFGSGPVNCAGESSQKGHIFAVDLKTGDPFQNSNNEWLFQTGESNAFMNTPCAFDNDQDFDVDAVYFGETYFEDGIWKGKVYRLTTSENIPDLWELSPVFDSPGPITSPLALSIDQEKNLWIYAGTGRYFNTQDKISSDTAYIFGIKDPLFENGDALSELSVSDLFDSDSYTSDFDFNTILDTARKKNGWIRTLTTSKERVLFKSFISGGIVFVPSFVPDPDISSFGGESFLYTLCFETGTFWTVLNNEAITDADPFNPENIDDKIQLVSDKASPLSIQADLEQQIKEIVRQSTDAILSETLSAPVNIKSRFESWKEE